MYNKVEIDNSINIKKVLTYIGFDLSLNGTKYLKDILLKVFATPMLLHSINSEVMKKVAEDYGTTKISVDRDVRWSILKAYSRGILGYVPCFANNKTPTTKQIIVWLFDFFN